MTDVVEPRRWRWGRGLTTLVLLLAPVGTAAATSAPSAPSSPGIDIDHVQVGEDRTVSVLLAVDRLPEGAAANEVTVEVDGSPVDATVEPVRGGEVRRTKVLALDTSNSMRGARISAARAAAHAFLDAAPADVRIGLVTFAGTVRTSAAPTADHGQLAGLVDGLALTAGTRVYDAILRAVDVAGAEGARSVLLLSDGRDSGSRADLARAVDAASDAGVVVDVVSLDQDPAHLAQMARVADGSGGAVLRGDAESLPQLFEDEADALAAQLLVTFTPPEGTGEDAALEVSVDAAGTTYADRALVALGAVEPPADSTPAATSRIGRTAFLLGAAALGLGLAGVLAVVLLSAVGPSAAQKHLAAYLGEEQAATAASGGGLKGQAVGIAESVVGGERSERLRGLLSGAAVSATPAEWVLIHAGIALLGGFVGLVLGGALLMVLLVLAGAAAPVAWLQLRRSRRIAAFAGQLPETLHLIAGGLSAGLSLPQALDTVVREGHEPMAGELRRALVEQRLGIDVEDALDAIAERMRSEDFAWVVMAVRIQHEVGGNLSEVLETVAETLREREYLRRQVKTLSAEGRLSAWILGVLPALMFGYMLMTNREYVQVFWTETVGMAMLGGAVVLLGSGAWFMSRLVKVQV